MKKKRKKLTDEEINNEQADNLAKLFSVDIDIMNTKELYPLLQQLKEEYFLRYGYYIDDELLEGNINGMLWDFDRIIKLHKNSKYSFMMSKEDWIKRMEEFNNILDKWSKVIE